MIGVLVTEANGSERLGVEEQCMIYGSFIRLQISLMLKRLANDNLPQGA